MSVFFRHVSEGDPAFPVDTPISGNSKPRQERSERQAVLNWHGFERICKLRTPVAAHLICLAFYRKCPAEVKVMTSKKEIKNDYKDLHRLYLT